MKKILFIFSLFFVGIVSAQEIKWMTMNEALQAQKKNPKKIFVDVYTHWCGPCKMLDKNTFANKDLVKYVNDKFYAVKFNAEGNEKVTYKEHTYSNPDYDPNKATTRNSVHEFTMALGVRAYPTMIIFDEKGDLLFPITGYYSASQLEPMIKLMGDNTYLKVKTQQEYDAYLKNFKGTFKEN